MVEPVAASVKALAQAEAHMPATVDWLPDGCLLQGSPTRACTLAERSRPAGWAFQLSLPIFQKCRF